MADIDMVASSSAPAGGVVGEPLVSIIIPCFKQAGFLTESVESGLSQTYRAVEVIVVDDESPDETPAVAARFGDRIVYRRQPNGGVAAARNAGLTLAKGEFVVFLDADDALGPTMVAEVVAAMTAAAADVGACGWVVVDKQGDVVDEHPAPVFEPDAFHAMMPSNLAPPVCIVFRRSAVDTVGGFDPDRGLNGHEDWDLLLRLADAGCKFVTVPKVLSRYRQYAGSSSTQHRRMFDTAMKMLAKTERMHPPCPACGGRYAQARQNFRLYYFMATIEPLVEGKVPGGDRWPAVKHFGSRSVRHPVLLPSMVKRLYYKWRGGLVARLRGR